MMRLIHGDCLEIMPELIKEGIKVDMILTDPPYLMNYYTGYRKDKTHDFGTPIANDTNFDLINNIIPMLYNILKEGGAVYMFCNANHIDYFKQQLETKFKIKNILIWVKNNWSAGDLKGAYAKQTEYILFASKGRHLLNGRRDTDVLNYNRVSGKAQIHQNQKPVDLLEFLIKKSSNPNNIILDCFMGSGSTGVACQNTNRNFIGIELEKKYYNIAVNRIKENNQTKLM